jgi:glycosyltransferase involved in cell wall biosynthesis
VTPPRLRVLHVIQNLNYGGMERLFADIVRLLDPASLESHVMVLGYLGRFGQGLERHATIHQAVPMSSASMLLPTGLTRQIRRIAPDVVHTHAGVWYKVSLAARLAGVPWLVHTEHGRQKPDPFSARLVGRLASRRTDRIVAVSAALGDHLAAHVLADPSRLRVLPNGVDTDEYRPADDAGRLLAALGFPPGTPVIGSIGRLEPIKGYDVVVEAFIRLCRDWRAGPSPALVLAGDGTERPRLEAMLAAGGVAAQARLLGWQDDTHALHAGFTLFTMGSRSEGTSVSLLEAMSAGLCPVVTDVGGNAAVLGPELAHRLVPPEQPAALCAAWVEALAAPEARCADGARARRRVERNFSLSRMVDGYAALYRRLEPASPS